MSLIDRMRDAKAALHQAEAAHPDSPTLAAVHKEGRRLIYLASRMGLITPAQVAELDEPPQAGTPKTDAPED
jgi:hypothetical protein